MVLYIIFLFILFLVLEGSNLLTYGNYISQKDTEFLTKYLKENQLELNPFGQWILYSECDKFRYITDVDLSPLCKYYVKGMGLVLRGSELHYLIKQQFKQAK